MKTLYNKECEILKIFLYIWKSVRQQYGQASADEKQILDISENILKNEDERKKISNQLFDEKTLVVYKEIFKLIEKSISYDDFVKLATEK